MNKLIYFSRKRQFSLTLLSVVEDVLLLFLLDQSAEEDWTSLFELEFPV